MPTNEKGSEQKINVFISYSHNDDIKYLNKLKTYLHERTCPLLNVWDDGKIQPGTAWDNAIKSRLANSQIILLLISQNFLISDYIDKIELPTALQMQKENKGKVIPIFTVHCNVDKDSPIRELQGLPKGMRFLSDLDDDIDAELSEIQKQINEAASALLTEININRAGKLEGDKNNTAAVEIGQLRDKRKIFLSIPDSPEARLKRKKLIIETDGWHEYDDWPYEIVPGVREAQEMDRLEAEDRKAAITQLLKESIYSIHIVGTEGTLHEGSDKWQYETATGAGGVFKRIVWLLTDDLKAKMEKDVAMNASFFSGEGFGDLQALITYFDGEKEQKIIELKKTFYPNKRVYLYYLYPTDHDKDFRIDLKTKIENRNFSVRCNAPRQDVEKINEDLAASEGALIFYGDADTDWFNVGQARLLDIKNLRTRGIGLDEPDKTRKFNRDVYQHEFITIQSENIDAALDQFLRPLQ